MYYQIQSQLLQMIQSGKLRPGDPLPSEDELRRACSVSRMTARHALQALENQGFASRHKGQGSFVSQPRVEKDIMHLAGFTAEMRALGLKPSSRLLSAETIPAPAEVASRLLIAIGTPVFYLRRLRYADGLPVAVEEVWLAREQYPGIDKIDFTSASLYQTLRERYGIRVSRADEILEARSATRQQAELLDLPRHASVLAMTRTLWSTDGKPIETAHSVTGAIDTGPYCLSPLPRLSKGLFSTSFSESREFRIKSARSETNLQSLYRICLTTCIDSNTFS